MNVNNYGSQILSTSNQKKQSAPDPFLTPDKMGKLNASQQQEVQSMQNYVEQNFVKNQKVQYMGQTDGYKGSFSREYKTDSGMLITEKYNPNDANREGHAVVEYEICDNLDHPWTTVSSEHRIAPPNATISDTQLGDGLFTVQSTTYPSKNTMKMTTTEQTESGQVIRTFNDTQKNDKDVKVSEKPGVS